MSYETIQPSGDDFLVWLRTIGCIWNCKLILNEDSNLCNISSYNEHQAGNIIVYSIHEADAYLQVKDLTKSFASTSLEKEGHESDGPLEKAFIEEKVKNFDEAFKCFEKSQLNLKYEDCNPVEFQNYIKTYRRNLDSKKYLEILKTL